MSPRRRRYARDRHLTSAPHWIAGAVVGGLLLVALPFRPWKESYDWAPLDDREVEVVRILRHVGDFDARPLPDLANQVVGHGGKGVSVLLQTLVSRVVPPIAGEAPQPVTGDQEQVVLLSLEAFGRRAVLPGVEALLVGSPTMRERSAAFLALGSVGTVDELGLFLEHRPPREHGLHPTEARAVRLGLAGLLRRDKRAMPVLVERWRKAHPDLFEPIIEAVADSRDRRGAEILGAMVVLHPDHASAAVAHLRRLGSHPDAKVNRAIAAFLRPRLGEARSTPEYLATVILGLGELQDFDSVPLLAEFVEHDSQVVRESSTWALRRMTGLSLGDDADSWAQWYVDEEAWFADRRADARARLQSPDPKVVAAAVHEYATHRLNRHELAEDLCLVLERDEDHLRRLACSALGRLDSPRAVEPIVPLLDEEDVELRDAAHGALKALTGLDHPPKSDVWRKALGLPPAPVRSGGLDNLD